MSKETRSLEGTPCPVCNAGQLHKGTRARLLEQADAVVVIKDVPGYVCDSCGEGYSDEETTRRVLRMARQAFERGAEVEVLRYGKAAFIEESSA